MEWLIIVVNGVGVGIIVYFLIKQKETLLAEIQLHKRFSDSAKTIVEIYEHYFQRSEREMKKIEEKIRKKAEEYEEKIAKRKEAIIFLVNEWRASSRLAMSAMFHIPYPEIRVRLIENMKDSMSKEAFLRDIDYYKKTSTLEDFYDLAQSLLKQPTEKRENQDE